MLNNNIHAEASGSRRRVTTTNHKRGGRFRKLKGHLKEWFHWLTVNRTIWLTVVAIAKVAMTAVKLFEMLRGLYNAHKD